MATAPTKTSDAGIDFIKRHEGRRLRAYRDSAGVLTIGYGHTRGVTPSQRITAEQADALLRADLADAERAVRDRVTVPLNQNEFDALASFIFNLGERAFRDSTMRQLLNSGAPRQRVAAQFARWVNAGGRRLQGLVNRRAAEAELFLRPVRVIDYRLAEGAGSD